MFSLKKTKKAYQVPRTAVAEVDLEGIICDSAHKNPYVDEYQHLYFEGTVPSEGESLLIEF